MLIYIGTSPGAKNDAKGIYRLRLYTETGKLTKPELAAEAARPSFLALHPKLPVLYSCSEVDDFEGKKSGGVESFTFDATSGELKAQSRQPSGGMGPCFVEADPLGKFVVVANYTSGSVALLPLDEAGKLREGTSLAQHAGTGPNAKRQEGPHAHSIRVGEIGAFALSADLGTDEVLTYRVVNKGLTLERTDPPGVKVTPGSGPRHLVIAGNYVYVVNEMANTITGFTFDHGTLALRELQTISTLPDSYKETSYAAEIALHPNGRFIYASNRGHDSIAVFAVAPTGGKLTAAGHTATQGKFPRHFALDPSGRFLLAANQNSGTLVLFLVDEQSGALTPTGESVDVPAPTCVRFVPLSQ
jgi:6-phosphogluconolactonase